MQISNALVREVLHQNLGLSYRHIKKIPVQANSEDRLVLRQQYALKMIELLALVKIIICVYESWISETEYSRRMWCPKTANGTVT